MNNKEEATKNLVQGLREKYKSEACVIAYLEQIISLETRFNPEFLERVNFHVENLNNEF